MTTLEVEVMLKRNATAECNVCVRAIKCSQESG